MVTVHPLRLLIKAGLIFLLVNLAFAWADPALGRLSIYNSVVPGRARFPFQDAEYQDLGYTTTLYDDFDAMFASHLISRRKAVDEYRIILLGDSSVWGYNLPTTDVLSEQLNHLNLMSCDHRQLRVYDLGYVGLYAPKDLLILARAVNYQPDLIVWMVTLNTLSENGRPLVDQNLAPHAAEALDLIKRYNLNIDTFGLRRETRMGRTLWARRSRLKKVARIQLDGFLWSATGLDFYVRDLPALSADVEDNPRPKSNRPHLTVDSGDLSLDVLEAGYQLAAPIPILTVNEPIFVASGRNSLDWYNSYYARRAYDQYRGILSDWMTSRGLAFMDLWDVVPPEMFRGTPLHYTAAGERLVAERLAPAILDFACP